MADDPGAPFTAAAQGDRAVTVGWQRLVDRPAESEVTVANVLAPHRERTLRRMADRDAALLVQDGTDMNLPTHPECGGLGIIGRNGKASSGTLGLHMHPALAVATDGPPHGRQEGRFPHGHHGHHRHLPLHVTCGGHVPCARLRPPDIDASHGALEGPVGIVAVIRGAWPSVRITVRGDSGFRRDGIMAWCEANGVDSVSGLARNPRLERRTGRQMRRPRSRCVATGEPPRRFTGFGHRTLPAWSRSRRVVARAGALPGPGGDSPRLTVTGLPGPESGSRAPCGDLHRARGDMENRIRERRAGAVRRPDLDGDHAGQPAAGVPSGLRRDAGPDRPGGRPRRDGPCQGAARHHPGAAPEGGLPAAGGRPPDPPVAVPGASISGAVPPGGGGAAAGRRGAGLALAATPPA